jgi:2-dehydro-3-deoxyphosphogluconate aldolase / (4S)-4-hydroxy-2-oxoglutarate aldolase
LRSDGTMNLNVRQQQTRDVLRRAGIMPVLTVDAVDEGVAVSQALLAGGIAAVEVTLRTPAAIEAIRAIRDAVPMMAVGAGTVIEPTQIDACLRAGAQFIVTPGTSDTMTRALRDIELPVIPGAATPSEMLALAEHGFLAQKLFPATAVGGLNLIRALASPLAHIAFCPTGGINEANANEFLRESNVLCVGGSWMVKREWIAEANFAAITDAAKRCRALIDTART